MRTRLHARNLGYLLITAMPVCSLPAGCGPSDAEFAAIDDAPLAGADWPASTPEAQGLDPLLVAELYDHAVQVEPINLVADFISTLPSE